MNTCKNCGKEIVRANGRSTGTYCDNKCQKGFEHKQMCEELIAYYEKHQAAPSTPGKNGPYTNVGVLKRYLIEKRGDKCEICGLETWQEKPLVKILDHIDGNSLNWKFSNLRLICSNCDSQLPTYKSKNKKSKREYRKKFTYK